jgi:8-oxo-dGTP pyrophosphatase MutT (NUDIX family)
MFNALALVEPFDLADDELGLKSKELIVSMLRYSPAPFSRDQFNPGHITCTALIFSPERRHVLLMWHHRFKRWLLPGGHVEEFDATLADTARREAIEETNVRLTDAAGVLAGMDVHGIPPKKKEPFHLHHDLLFAMQAASDEIAATEEAPKVEWCEVNGLARYNAPANIVRATLRAQRLSRLSSNRTTNPDPTSACSR